MANLLASLECVCVEQDGDDGKNVSFDVADFDLVASVLKPRKRRKLSPPHLTALRQGRDQWERKQVSESGNGQLPEDPEDLATKGFTFVFPKL